MLLKITTSEVQGDLTSAETDFLSIKHHQEDWFQAIYS